MKNLKAMLVSTALVATTLTASLSPSFAQESAAAPAVAPESVLMHDGDGAVYKRFTGMHQVRYLEIFLAGREASSGKLVAPTYNTMFIEGAYAASKDTAPQALVEGIDLAQLKKDYNLAGASLNGPKIWTPDWSDADIGKVREFNGIKAPWVGKMYMDNAGPVSNVTSYKPMVFVRKSQLGWNKGTTVMILDDADGNTYVMKGFQQGLKPQHTYAQFMAAGQSNFKKLPEGWKFRVKTLDKDLIETPENGQAQLVADEFFNVYDKTGPGMSNYKP